MADITAPWSWAPATRWQDIERFLLPCSIDYLSSLHPDPPPDLASCRAFIYTDGSGGGGDKPPSWAFAILLLHSSGSWHFGGFFAGVLDLDAIACPPAHASLAAEATALIWAVCWSVQASCSSYSFHVDNASVVRAAPGSGGMPDVSGLANCLRSVVLVLQQRASTFFQHVKSHLEDPMNEMADTLCALASLKIVAAPTCCPWAGWLRDPLAASWAWLDELSCDGRAQYPPVFQGDFVLVTDAPGLSDVCPPRVVQLGGEHDLPFSRKAMSAPGVSLSRSVVPNARLSMTIAFANILSLRAIGTGKKVPVGLYASGRPRMLAAQFEAAKLAVVGTAESRVPRAGWTDIGNYLVLHGPATSKGTHGCSLWLRKGVPLVPSLSGSTVQRHLVHVALAEPTMLVVNLAVGTVSLTFCVGHAPHTRYDKDDIKQWWLRFSGVVQKARAATPYTFLLLDANATVGAIPSDAVGPVAKEKENFNGQEFHRCLKDCAFTLPSTFQGDPNASKTWTPPQCMRATRRIDYVAVPVELGRFAGAPLVNRVVELAISRPDHALVQLDFSLPIPDLRPFQGIVSSKPRLDRSKLADPVLQGAFAEFLDSAPKPNWSVPPSQHCTLVSQFVRQGMTQFFEADSGKKATGFSDNTRSHVTALHRSRRALSQVRDVASRLWARMVLFCWRASSPSPPSLEHSVPIFRGRQPNSELRSKVFCGWKTRVLGLVAARHSLQFAGDIPRGACDILSEAGRMLRQFASVVRTSLPFAWKQRLGRKINRKAWVPSDHAVVSFLMFPPGSSALQGGYSSVGRKSVQSLACLLRALALRASAFQYWVLLPQVQQVHDVIKAEAQQKLQDIAKSVGDAWSKRDFSSAYSALRLLGAAGKRHRQHKVLPALQGPDGKLLQTVVQAHDAWLQHFAAQELAALVSPDLFEVVCQDVVADLKGGQRAIENIPTFSDFEKSLRRTGNGAAGPDGLHGSFVRACSAPLAKVFFPLVFKSAMLVCEPIQWKGGDLPHIPKGKGDPTLATSSRSILVASHIGKRYHACLRAKMIPAIRDAVGSSQFAAIPGRGTPMAILAARVMQRYAIAKKLCIGFLFVDVVNAFYTAIRELVLATGTSRDSLRNLLANAGLPADYLPLLEARLEELPLLRRHGLSDHFVGMVEEAFRLGWFQVPGAERLAITFRGTRPGTPFGDAVFIFIIAEVTKRVSDLLEEAGLLFQVDSPTGDICSSPSGEQKTGVPGLVYADDSGFVLVAPFDQFVQALPGFCKIVLNSFAPVGLLPHMKVGKTELLLDLKGVGSAAFKRDLFKEPLPSIAVEGLLCGGNSIPVVRSTVYLGSMLDDKASLGPELAYRDREASGAMKALRRAVAKAPNKDIPPKLYLLDSLSVNAALYAAGTWYAMTKAELSRLQCHYIRRYRGLLRMPRYEAGGPSDLAVLARAGRPTVATIVRVSRLRLFGQLLASAPSPLLALLNAEFHVSRTSWLHTIWDDLLWLRSSHPRFKDFGLPSADLAPWLAEIRKSPGGWKRALRAAILASVSRLQRDVQAARWQERVLTMLSSNGLPPRRDLPPPRESAKHRCHFCPAEFDELKSLDVHIRREHFSYTDMARKRVNTYWCACCMKVCASRSLLVRHITAWKPTCLVFYLKHIAPLPQEELSALAAEETAHNVARARQGYSASRGRFPSFTAPGPLSLHAVTVQANYPRAAAFRFINETVEQITGWTRQSLVPHVLEEPEVAWDPSPSEIEWPFVEGDFSGSLAITVPRRILRRQVFVANLFCGQRRAGDVQQAIELSLAQYTPSFELIVLSVDILLDSDIGDLRKSSSIQCFADHIWSGRIAALGGGPPCETFCAARWREGGPPPLRSWQAPWGVTGLSSRQQLQVSVSNDLLQAMIELLAIMAVSQGCAWMEHPAPPSWEPRSVPSWSFLPLKGLAAAPCAEITTFDQCEFGQIGRAPTAILGIRLPDLPGLLHATPGGGYCSHGARAHTALVGWDSELKRWRTSPKKVYPPAMCHVLATAMLKSLLPSLLGQAPSLAGSLVDDSGEVQALMKFFVDSSRIGLGGPDLGPDFAGLDQKPPRPPSALTRVASLLNPGSDRIPGEEEELEGTHSVAMASAGSQRPEFPAFGEFPSEDVPSPPPPPPPPLPPDVLSRISANRAEALRRRRERRLDSLRVPVRLAGLFGKQPEPPPRRDPVQTDLHRWFQLAIDNS